MAVHRDHGRFARDLRIGENTGPVRASAGLAAKGACGMHA